MKAGHALILWESLMGACLVLRFVRCRCWRGTLPPIFLRKVFQSKGLGPDLLHSTRVKCETRPVQPGFSFPISRVAGLIELIGRWMYPDLCDLGVVELDTDRGGSTRRSHSTPLRAGSSTAPLRGFAQDDTLGSRGSCGAWGGIQGFLGFARNDVWGASSGFGEMLWMSRRTPVR